MIMRHFSQTAVLALVLVFLLTVPPVRAAEPTTTPSGPAPISARISYQVSDSYRIGVGDILSITVQPQDEYSSNDILVRSDGKATFSRIGEFSVYGKRISDLTTEISNKLASTLQNHTVTINVTNTRPALFYLTGAVNRIGPFEMSTNARDRDYSINNETSERRLDLVLTNILANAGGLKLNADLAHVQIKRQDTDEVQTVDLWKVLKEGSAENNPWLNPGDSIYVPELLDGSMMNDEQFKMLANSTLSPKNFPIRVIGEVKNPSLVKLEGETPLLSTAIAIAGGFTPMALKDIVAVRRFTDENHFTTLFIDTRKMDFMLRPNDIVYVGESKLYKTGRFMQQAAMILSPFSELAGTGASASQVFGFGGWQQRKLLNSK
jgi:protein involved in polysaccharide export with SLBB domain